MKLIANATDVKLITTYQGVYLKAGPQYKYMLVLLPENFKVSKTGTELIIDVDDAFYKRKRLYRFDKNHIHNFKVEDVYDGEDDN